MPKMRNRSSASARAAVIASTTNPRLIAIVRPRPVPIARTLQPVVQTTADEAGGPDDVVLQPAREVLAQLGRERGRLPHIPRADATDPVRCLPRDPRLHY